MRRMRMSEVRPRAHTHTHTHMRGDDGWGAGWGARNNEALFRQEEVVGEFQGGLLKQCEHCASTVIV
jgi:hypothetical protein